LLLGVTRADCLEPLPVVRQLFGQSDLSGDETVDPIAGAIGVQSLSLFRRECAGELIRQSLEEAEDAGVELLAVTCIVGDRQRQSARASALHDDVEAHEVDRLLDALPHLRVDERQQVARLAVSRPERHGSVRRGCG